MKQRPPALGPSRREWLRWLALSGASLGVAASCGDNATQNPAPRDITAAVMEPTADGFVVAIWSAYAVEVFVTVEDLVSGLSVATQIHSITATGNAHAWFTGLPPATRYRVLLDFADGRELGPYLAQTRPPSDRNASLRLLIAADIDPSPDYVSPIFSAMTDYAADLAVSIGDFPYTDNGPKVAKTVAAYRAVHANARSTPRIARWLASSSLCAIYDDHEFRNDWSPRFVAAEAERYAAAMQVYDEFFPQPGAPPNVRYRAWQWGAQVDGFMLDCRRFRAEPSDPAGPQKSMLGAIQKQWFLQRLAASTAPCKLIFTSVPLDFGTGNEHWNAYTHERDEIYAAISAADIRGVLFISADQHWFEARRYSNGAREFQIGAVARGILEPPPMQAGVLARALTYNFATIEIADGQIYFQDFDANGSELYAERLDAASLRIRQP